MIQITVKTLDNQNRTFEVENEAKVWELKEKIRDVMKIPVDCQRLIFAGHLLSDNSRLADHNLDGKVIHLVPRPPPPSHTRNSRRSAYDRSEQRPRTRSAPGPPPQLYWSLEPPPVAVQEQNYMQDLGPVSGRLDFIRQTMIEIRNSIDYLRYYNEMQIPYIPPDGASTSRNLAELEAELDREEAGPSNIGTHSEEDQLSPSTYSPVPPAPRPSPASSNNEPSTSHAARASEESASSAASPFFRPIPVRRSPLPPTRSVLATRSDMAELLEELTELHELYEPYRRVHVSILRERRTKRGRNPLSSEEQTRITALTELVGDVNHSFAHLYHALSDLKLIMCDYSNKLVADTANEHPQPNFQSFNIHMSPTGVTQITPLSNYGVFRHGSLNLPADNPSGSAPTTQRRNQPFTSGQPGTTVDVTFHQVSGDRPIRNPGFLTDVVANIQTVFDAATQSGIGSAGPSINMNHPRGQQPQNQPGANQAGANQGQADRPRGGLDVENMVRSLRQASGFDVLMSLDEIQPINLDSPDIFPSDPPAGVFDPQHATFLPFDLGAALAASNAGQAGGQGNSNDNNPTVTGIRFLQPGGGNIPRFNMPPFGAGPEGPAGAQPAMGVTLGPAVTMHSDLSVFLSSMIPAVTQGDTLPLTMQNILRGNVYTSAPTFGTSGSSGSASSSGVQSTNSSPVGPTMTASAPDARNATTASGSNPSPRANINTSPPIGITRIVLGNPLRNAPRNANETARDPSAFGPTRLVGNPVTFRHEFADYAARNNAHPEARPGAGGSQATSQGTARGAAPNRRRGMSDNNRPQTRTQQQALDEMVYDRYMPCRSRYANERLNERRLSYVDIQLQESFDRYNCTYPIEIERLRDLNINMTMRHMARMMRLLSGPSSNESALNAFMVAVARVLFLEPNGPPGSRRPNMMPQEFYFTRMHMRHYLQYAYHLALEAGERRGNYDQVAGFILADVQHFIDTFDSVTPILPGVSTSLTLRRCLRDNLANLLCSIFGEFTTEFFVNQFYTAIVRFFKAICACVFSICANGFRGFWLLYTEFIDHLTEGFDVNSREWLRLVAQENLLAIQSTIDPNMSPNFVYQDLCARSESEMDMQSTDENDDSVSTLILTSEDNSSTPPQTQPNMSTSSSTSSPDQEQATAAGQYSERSQIASPPVIVIDSEASVSANDLPIASPPVIVIDSDSSPTPSVYSPMGTPRLQTHTQADEGIATPSSRGTYSPVTNQSDSPEANISPTSTSPGGSQRLPVVVIDSSDASDVASPPVVEQEFDEQWLPVLVHDQRLQIERIRPPEPLSDSYLVGMHPRKRRRIVSTRPPNTLDGLVAETVRSAADQVTIDDELRNRMIESIRNIVRERAEASEDFNPARYPPTARFLEQTPPSTPEEEAGPPEGNINKN